MLFYHPQPVYWADSKEIAQAWFRTGNAHASIVVIEFVKQLLAHLSNGMRINIRVNSDYFVGALSDLLAAQSHGYPVKYPKWHGQNRFGRFKK